MGGDAQLLEQLARSGARCAGVVEAAGLEDRQHVLLRGQAAEDARLLRQVADAVRAPACTWAAP